MSLREQIELLRRKWKGEFVFMWDELKWQKQPGDPDTQHAVIRIGFQDAFEIWTHDRHETYALLITGSGKAQPPNYNRVRETLARRVPRLEANCICIDWFEKNRPYM